MKVEPSFLYNYSWFYSFFRTCTIRRYELIPLWSWKKIILCHDWNLLKEDLLNCVLLLPAGILLPIVRNRKVKWSDAFIFGVFISAVIEICQLIFKRGLFEWDDMIHNGLGCMVGCVIANCLLVKWKVHKCKNGNK